MSIEREIRRRKISNSHKAAQIKINRRLAAASKQYGIALHKARFSRGGYNEGRDLRIWNEVTGHVAYLGALGDLDDGTRSMIRRRLRKDSRNGEVIDALRKQHLRAASASNELPLIDWERSLIAPKTLDKEAVSKQLAADWWSVDLAMTVMRVGGHWVIDLLTRRMESKPLTAVLVDGAKMIRREDVLKWCGFTLEAVIKDLWLCGTADDDLTRRRTFGGLHGSYY